MFKLSIITEAGESLFLIKRNFIPRVGERILIDKKDNKEPIKNLLVTGVIYSLIVDSTLLDDTRIMIITKIY